MDKSNAKLVFASTLVAAAVISLTLDWNRRRKRRFRTPWAALSTKHSDSPRSARWLASVWAPNQSSPPHAFRSSGSSTGLRPLNLNDWLEIEPIETSKPQLKLKRELILGEETGSRFYASNSLVDCDVLDAEREVLEILINHLETHFPDKYSVVRSSSSANELPAVVIELMTGQEFHTADYQTCPLKLCGLLVQEDFILLSPGDADGPPSCCVAGCATFTFMEVGLPKLDASLACIHTPVPGFNCDKGIGPRVAKYFQQLQPESPQYRTNWMLVAEEGLNPMRYDPNSIREGSVTLDPNITAPEPEAYHLRVELQSIRRLVRTRYILFTLHCYSDPLPRLRVLPEAAAVLRQALLDLDENRRQYRGMTMASVERVAEYLKELAGDAV